MSYTSPPPSYDELYDSSRASTSSPSSTSLFGSLKQSLTSLTMAPSKIDLEILPLDSVDMYGEPDKDAAYSLSGQILVKLVPPTSWFCSDVSQAEESFFLDSLVVTFEGQSELVSPQTGHAACRLIEFSKELITDKPIVIRHSWSEDTTRNPAQWYVTFNLNLPGWLPPTCNTPFGDSTHEEPEVSYRLSAVAKYREDKPAQPSSWRTACYEYMKLPTSQIVKASSINITINRFFIPPPRCTLANSEFPDAPFRSVEYFGTMKEDSTATIPAEILSKLRMRAVVPERIPMDAESFPLIVKIRPDGLSLEDRKRLQTPGFLVNVFQTEVVRASMSTQYANEWPVPPPAEQPPNRALPTRRLDGREYECGLIYNPPADTSALRTFSALPVGFDGKFELDAAKASFADAGDAWVRVRVDVPVRAVLVDARRLPQYADHPLPTLRPSARGPLLTVRHSLEITLACAYDLPPPASSSSSSDPSIAGPPSSPAPPERVLDELKFTIPLTFVRVPRSGPFSPRVEPFGVTADTAPGSPLSGSGAVRMVPSQPYAQPLPAYNTLYHKNGARREDPTPLPVYTKDGGREHEEEHPLEQGGDHRVDREQRIDGEEAEAGRPAVTICKKTPLHKVAADYVVRP